MTFDLYAWSAPRDLDADGAAALVASWEERGGDPATSPFEPTTDVGWFHRELMKDAPGLEVSSDAVPNPSTRPVWLSGENEPPARIVAIRLPASASGDVLDEIYSLAMKYDLVLFDARSHRVHQPLGEVSEYASATFWPRGAIQAAVAGGLGGLVAIGAWVLRIPVVSGVVALAGGFMVVMAVYSFIHEGRKAISARRAGGSSPPRS